MSSGGWRRVMRDADEVTLRDVVADDIPVFFEYQRDPQACAMAEFPARSWDAHASHWARILDDETVLTRTILVDGQVAGNVVSFVQDGPREAGYWIDRALSGKGVATRALSAFLDHEQTRPLSAHVAKHNTASRRVLEQCGFTLSGEDSEGYRLELSDA